MGDFSTAMPSFAAGQPATASDLQILADLGSALADQWTSTWSPTLTNITLGSGSTTTARYRRIGKTLDYHLKIVLGTGGALGTNPRFTLPYAPHSSYVANDPLGKGFLLDPGVNGYTISVRLQSGSTCELVYLATNDVHTAVTATLPFTSGVGDGYVVDGTVELA